MTKVYKLVNSTKIYHSILDFFLQKHKSSASERSPVNNLHTLSTFSGLKIPSGLNFVRISGVNQLNFNVNNCLQYEIILFLI